MIDVQTVRCPSCGHGFDFSSYIGEELLDSDVRLVKGREQRTSWAELDGEIRSGRAELILDVGDTLSFTLKNGTQVSVKVAAINPYGNNVAFSFDDIFWDNCMNSTNTNNGGWADSDMADFLDKEIFPLFPDELQAVIQAREIVQKQRSTIYKRESKLWLPSYTEVFGRDERYSACDIGDVQFPLFTMRKGRVRFDKDDDIHTWWLRSPNVGSSTGFWYVYSGGNGGNGSASNASGVCPCFIIGEKPEVEVEE